MFFFSDLLACFTLSYRFYLSGFLIQKVRLTVASEGWERDRVTQLFFLNKLNLYFNIYLILNLLGDLICLCVTSMQRGANTFSEDCLKC